MCICVWLMYIPKKQSTLCLPNKNYSPQNLIYLYLLSLTYNLLKLYDKMLKWDSLFLYILYKHLKFVSRHSALIYKIQFVAISFHNKMIWHFLMKYWINFGKDQSQKFTLYNPFLPSTLTQAYTSIFYFYVSAHLHTCSFILPIFLWQPSFFLSVTSCHISMSLLLFLFIAVTPTVSVLLCWDNNKVDIILMWT